MDWSRSNKTLASFYIGHARRCRQLMAHLLQALLDTRNFEMSYTTELEELLLYGAFHHDIGKLAIPPALLLKPDKLTADEFHLVQGHTWMGENLAKALLHGSAKELKILEHMCRHHHERWDGTGYPDGLAGRDISYPARLMAVVDVYDALTHERPYKEAYNAGTARLILEAGTGTQFDPVVAKTFLNHVLTQKTNDYHPFRKSASTL